MKTSQTINSSASPILSSKVEKYYLEKSDKQLCYKPTEKIPVIQVENFPELGKFTALRFIEWAQTNPNGVVSLPTGKTPEHFIKWIEKIMKDWETKPIQNELKKVGLDYQTKPNFWNLRFVQIDEFYPIDSNQQNSFYYYIKKYYLQNLGLDPEKAHFINTNKIPTPNNLPLKTIFPDNKVDLTLRTRYAGSDLEKLQKDAIAMVDQFCTNYEMKIREMGGINFFLGGIGPDGHIGFNVKGSDHFSTTRLITTNYETQSAAATDLGGMEIARNSLVITIGLSTITFDKNAVAIIIASGQSKGNIVRDSVQNQASNEYPATSLQVLPNARFYLTKGAAFRLIERRNDDLKIQKKLSQENIERAIINLVVKKRKRLIDLTIEDYLEDKFSNLVLKKKNESPLKIGKQIASSLKSRMIRGLQQVSNEVILHTAPHHDDIELGYLHYITGVVRNPSNKHHFSIFTSGFTAVTNMYMLNQMEKTKYFLDNNIFEKRFDANYFDPEFINGRDREVSLHSDGIAALNPDLCQEAISRRMIRNLIEVYKEKDFSHIKNRVDELINYFKTQYPGKKDIPEVQKLKGMIREWEVELFWHRYGFSVKDITHLRLGFYQGDIFTEIPVVERDVLPVVDLLEKIKPTIITVALDPESSGPDTHYKVMQVLSAALKIFEAKTGNNQIRVLGYRNVWSKFHPAEANIYVPISLNSFATLEDAFMNSFGSQKNASFPSWEYDGPFSRLVQKIQVDQYNTIRSCLGFEYFSNHKHPKIRSAKGILLLKELSLNEFYKYSIELKKLTEQFESK